MNTIHLREIYCSLADNYNVPITSGPMMALNSLIEEFGQPVLPKTTTDTFPLENLAKFDNNGGKTSYYDLPLPNRLVLYDILTLLVNKDIRLEDTINLIFEACPNTLNDLIEYKKMQPWQHEVLKATYAINERTEKNGGSELRELNKIIYYTLRRRKQLDAK